MARILDFSQAVATPLDTIESARAHLQTPLRICLSDDKMSPEASEEREVVQPASEEHEVVQPASEEHDAMQPASEEHGAQSLLLSEEQYHCSVTFHNIAHHLLLAPAPPFLNFAAPGSSIFAGVTTDDPDIIVGTGYDG